MPHALDWAVPNKAVAQTGLMAHLTHLGGFSIAPMSQSRCVMGSSRQSQRATCKHLMKETQRSPIYTFTQPSSPRVHHGLRNHWRESVLQRTGPGRVGWYQKSFRTVVRIPTVDKMKCSRGSVDFRLTNLPCSWMPLTPPVTQGVPVPFGAL